jgi:hypothetical protein
MRRAGTTAGDPLRDAIAATDGYRGATGAVSFDGGADPGRQVAISEVVAGGLVTRMLVGR